MFILSDQFMLIAGRIFTALALSGLIGFERELKKHSAGFRTHILVGVGSCLMMLLSLYGFDSYIDKYDNVRFDPGRIPSYVISGIGFLGAGTIIVNGVTIKGLTTAASIWAVAGLGLVVGVGMYGVAILTTVVILLSLIFLNNFEKHVHKNRKKTVIRLVIDSQISLGNLIEELDQYPVTLKQLVVAKTTNGDQIITVHLDKSASVYMKDMFKHFSEMEHVKNINIE